MTETKQNILPEIEMEHQVTKAVDRGLVRRGLKTRLLARLAVELNGLLTCSSLVPHLFLYCSSPCGGSASATSS